MYEYNLHNMGARTGDNRHRRLGTHRTPARYMAPLEQAFEHELRAFKRRNDTIGYWNFHLRGACTERQYNHLRPEVATRSQLKENPKVISLQIDRGEGERFNGCRERA